MRVSVLFVIRGFLNNCSRSENQTTILCEIFQFIFYPNALNRHIEFIYLLFQISVAFYDFGIQNVNIPNSS